MLWRVVFLRIEFAALYQRALYSNAAHEDSPSRAANPTGMADTLLPPPMQRIAVIGTTGSGKSTLAKQLGEVLELPYIGIDNFYWRPNWIGVPDEELLDQVDRWTSAERWVIEGNYSRTRHLIWTRADTLVWLDYSFPMTFWRLLTRTVRRLWTREDLWGTGNRESLKKSLSRDSILLWCIQTHGKNRRRYPGMLAEPQFGHLTTLRFTKPAQTRQWLAELRASSEHGASTHPAVR